VTLRYVAVIESPRELRGYAIVLTCVQWLWQFPFHIALEPPKGGLVDSLYESYHGAYVNIQVPCLSIFLFPNGLLEDAFLSIFMIFHFSLLVYCLLFPLLPLLSWWKACVFLLVLLKESCWCISSPWHLQCSYCRQ
jgi:hypothetical protein